MVLDAQKSENTERTVTVNVDLLECILISMSQSLKKEDTLQAQLTGTQS